jgi:hypothetical protein
MPSLDAGGGAPATLPEKSTAGAAADANSSVKNGGKTVDLSEQDLAEAEKETESEEKRTTTKEEEKEEERLKDVNNDLEMSSDEDSRHGSDIEEWPADKPKVPVPVISTSHLQ